MSEIFETQKFKNMDKLIEQNEANYVLCKVVGALREKGYDPVSQIVGYVLSGDPTYITGHNNARAVISKIERDEILEELVKYYLDNNI